MNRSFHLVPALLILTMLAAPGWSQGEAELAYQEARGLYASEQYAQARDLLRSACELAPERADLFLLLGKAHYQLVELEAAGSAWQRSLELAPDQTWVRAMLAALAGQDADLATQLRLVEALLADGLLEPAARALAQVETGQGISAEHHVQALHLRAALALARDRIAQAQTALQELSSRFPTAAASPRSRLLRGQTALRAGGDSAAEGVALLRAVQAEDPDSDAAARAALSLLEWQLASGPPDGDGLAAWLADHPAHALRLRAQRRLVTVRFAAAAGAAAVSDGQLAALDLQALQACVALLAELQDGNQRLALSAQAVAHLQARYGQRAAYTGHIAGLQRLLTAAPRPREHRLLLTNLAEVQAQAALAELRREAAEGRLRAGALPAALAEAADTLAALREAFPDSGWGGLARLATEVAAVRAPSAVDQGLTATDAWALRLALPCVASAGDGREAASQLIHAIAQSYAARGDVAGHSLAEEVLLQLLAELPDSDEAWPGVAFAINEQRAAHSRLLLADPASDAATTLSEPQRALIELASQLVVARPAQAPQVFQRLTEHLEAWLESGCFAVAEEAWNLLLADLPSESQAEGRLQRVLLWSRQVAAGHRHLLETGLRVPTELDPTSRRALEECYRLQAELAANTDLAARLRAAREQLVGRFVALQAWTTAEEALQVRAVPAVDAADAHAELALAQLYRQMAERELALLLAELDGQARLERSPAFTRAWDAYQQFLSARPRHEAAAQAVEGMFQIGRLFEDQAAYQVAAQLYLDLEAFGATLPWLEPNVPGSAGFRDRAALAAGQALYRHAFAAARDASAPQVLPKADLSPAFQAALDAYLHIFASYPERPAAASARAGLVAIARFHAQSHAWSVAAAVLATLLEAVPELAQPEDIALARATCLLGVLRPEHALQLLTLHGFDADLQFASGPQAIQATPVLAAAELERQIQAQDAAYAAFQELRQSWPGTPASDRARQQLLGLADHWRNLARWHQAADVLARFLHDNPRDPQLPELRLLRARDLQIWASLGAQARGSLEDQVEAIRSRYQETREALTAIIADFPGRQAVRQQAQWSLATSHLEQAHVIAAAKPDLARGQFLHAAQGLLAVAGAYPEHPNIGQVPQMLANIGQELRNREGHQEAIDVWTQLSVRFPTLELADHAALWVAETHQQRGRPLSAAEAYLELNFSRGGHDAALQDAILAIALQLRQESRWIESLRVLETFVDSFPQHARAAEAMTTIGQIHELNAAWPDALSAYQRVRSEVEAGPWAAQAQWSIAQCTINLSRWREAVTRYRAFASAYPNDARVSEAERRIVILKQLARYQDLIDEPGQRKAFDAQFQLGAIAHGQLNNPVKAIEEYRKVAVDWPDSHLADDALYQVGVLQLQLGALQAARDALQQLAASYPSSPLADDALFLVGSSYADEADRLAAVTRGGSVLAANDLAQRQAYQLAQGNRRNQRERNAQQLAELQDRGEFEELDKARVYQAAQNFAFDNANTLSAASWAEQQAEVFSAEQLADRQDKINAALRRAVAAFSAAAQVDASDKADAALLRIAEIQDTRLQDAEAAMATWLEITRQYSGTSVAENASWKIALHYERANAHEQAIDAYTSFLRNYRRSPHASDAQFAVAENLERLGRWVEAMDAYTKYLTNFPEGPLRDRAQDQIDWIKTYRL